MSEDVHALLREVAARIHAGSPKYLYPTPTRILRFRAGVRGAWTEVTIVDVYHTFKISYCERNSVIEITPRQLHPHDDGTLTYLWNGRAFRLVSRDDVTLVWRWLYEQKVAAT